nr:Cap [Kummerowia striata CRESS virus]
MVRTSVKSITYSSGSRKYAASRSSVARARQVLRARMAGVPRAPLRSGGFYGLYTGRGRNELKVCDNPAGSGSFATAGIVVLLNGIAQGTDYTNRIGRKVMLKSWLFRISVVPKNTASAPYGDICRIMLLYDCQTNAATPAVTDILNSADYNAPMNLNNRDRFKVLADKYVTIASFNYAAGALTTGSPTPKQTKIYKKMNYEEIFGGTGSTVGSINTGGLFVLFISLTGNTTYLYDSRVRFYDA